MLKEDQRSQHEIYNDHMDHLGCKATSASVMAPKRCCKLSGISRVCRHHRAWRFHSVGICLPGWLGRANMLLSLIAKLALCCRMRSSPGCLAGLTWRQHAAVWPHGPAAWSCIEMEVH